MTTSPATILRMAARTLAALAVAAGLIGTVAVVASANSTPATVGAPPVARLTTAVHPAATVPAQPICAAPSTAAGFQALFATVPVEQFGAADGGLSVKLGDGRSVWMFGDTFSTGHPFLPHSTTIVQDRCHLHVTNKGAQLIPNIATNGTLTYRPTNRLQWMGGATAVGAHSLRIWARGVRLTGTCAWCFTDDGYTQTWTVTFAATGDTVNLPAAAAGRPVLHVTPGTVTRGGPIPDPGKFTVLSPHHFTYSRHTHPEFRMADGRMLVSTAQNWDDGKYHPFADYRLIFTEESAR